MALKDIVPFKRKDVPVRRKDDNPFALLRKEMDSLFDSFFRGFDIEPFEVSYSGFIPRINVAETEKEVRVSAELPGTDEKDIDVSLQNDILTIKGEKKQEKEDRGKDYYTMERSYGSFSRSIQIPAEVETDKIEAKFKKGVLTVTLPKTTKAVEETKKIAVTLG